MPKACDQASISGKDTWVTLDLASRAGQQLRVRVCDNTAVGCGVVSVDHIHMGRVR